MELSKEQRQIMKNGEKLLEEHGLSKDKDYNTYLTTVRIHRSNKWCICVEFRLKGNKEVIQCLETEGWLVDKRYRRDINESTVRDPLCDDHYSGPGCVVIQNMVYIIENA